MQEAAASPKLQLLWRTSTNIGSCEKPMLRVYGVCDDAWGAARCAMDHACSAKSQVEDVLDMVEAHKPSFARPLRRSMRLSVATRAAAVHAAVATEAATAQLGDGAGRFPLLLWGMVADSHKGSL